MHKNFVDWVSLAGCLVSTAALGLSWCQDTLEATWMRWITIHAAPYTGYEKFWGFVSLIASILLLSVLVALFMAFVSRRWWNRKRKHSLTQVLSLTKELQNMIIQFQSEGQHDRDNDDGAVRTFKEFSANVMKSAEDLRNYLDHARQFCGQKSHVMAEAVFEHHSSEVHDELNAPGDPRSKMKKATWGVNCVRKLVNSMQREVNIFLSALDGARTSR